MSEDHRHVRDGMGYCDICGLDLADAADVDYLGEKLRAVVGGMEGVQVHRDGMLTQASVTEIVDAALGALGAHDPTLAGRLSVYCAARGIPVPNDAGTEYLAGEVKELRDAIAGGDQDAIRHEIADVALALTAVARTHELTIEECIQVKTAYDTGRSGPPAAPQMNPLAAS